MQMELTDEQFCENLVKLLLTVPEHRLKINGINDLYSSTFRHVVIFPDGKGVSSIKKRINLPPYTEYFDYDEQSKEFWLKEGLANDLLPEPTFDDSPSKMAIADEPQPSFPSILSVSIGNTKALSELDLSTLVGPLPPSEYQGLVLDISSMEGKLNMVFFDAEQRVTHMSISTELLKRQEGQHVLEFLSSESVLKVVHDLYKNRKLFLEEGGLGLTGAFYDSELAYEFIYNAFTVTPMEVLASNFEEDNDIIMPLRGRSITAQLVGLLKSLQSLIFSRLTTIDFLFLKEAAEKRMGFADSKEFEERRVRRVYFDSDLCSLRSLELCSEEKSQDPEPLQVDEELSSIFRLIPRRLIENATGLMDDAKRLRLMEIILDLGRRPRMNFVESKENKERFYLHSSGDVVVERDDLERMVAQLHVGSDNRAGLEGTLHRVSVMWNKSEPKQVIGITIRVGRTMTGNIQIIKDLLLAGDNSICFLGKPGTGKTTCVREISRILADEGNEVNKLVVKR